MKKRRSDLKWAPKHEVLHSKVQKKQKRLRVKKVYRQSLKRLMDNVKLDIDV